MPPRRPGWRPATSGASLSRLASADSAALTSGSAEDEARAKSLFDLAGCTRSPEWGKGRGVAVVFDDIPALMIYRTPVGGTPAGRPLCVCQHRRGADHPSTPAP